MQQRPPQVYLTGARVGGSYANLMVQANVIVAAHHSGVHKLFFPGPTCIYPRMAAQPVEDDALFRGTLESTNLCGPAENYHPENSDVIPALIRRFHGAKVSGVPEVAIWASGKPRREFLFVDDMARSAFSS